MLALRFDYLWKVFLRVQQTCENGRTTLQIANSQWLCISFLISDSLPQDICMKKTINGFQTYNFLSQGSQHSWISYPIISWPSRQLIFFSKISLVLWSAHSQSQFCVQFSRGGQQMPSFFFDVFSSCFYVSFHTTWHVLPFFSWMCPS